MGMLKNALSAVASVAVPSAFLGQGAAYEAGSYGLRELEDWHPVIQSADDEVLDSREAVVSRARDLFRNHPVVSGAVNKIADAIIGSKVMLDARPLHDLLRRDIEWALDWSLKTEAEFKAWGYSPQKECDIERRKTFGQIARLLLVTKIVDGEYFYIVRNKASGRRYTTCIEVIDTDRVCNPNGVAENQLLANGNTIYAGIEYAPDNEPVAYHVRVKHPAALDTTGQGFKWVRVPRFSDTGKPVMVHGYREHRAGQRRGISGLASVIKRVRMNDNYDVAELEAALFDAINAGFVTSPYPQSEVAGAMAPTGNDDSQWSLSKQVEYRQKNKVSLKNGVRMIFGLPGEKFDFKSPARPAGNYPAFKGAGQHDLAAGVGLSYSQTSEDWADINYSSGKLLLNEKYKGFDSLGEEFGSQGLSPIYDAWSEEAVAIGTVKMPGGAQKFYTNRTLITFCSWLRPGRGQIDPLKEEQASDYRVNAGRSNNAIETANNGLDFYEVAMGQAREEMIRKRLKTGPFVPLKAVGGAGSEAGDGSGGPGTEDDRDGDGIANETERERERRDERRQQRTGAAA